MNFKNTVIVIGLMSFISSTNILPMQEGFRQAASSVTKQETALLTAVAFGVVSVLAFSAPAMYTSLNGQKYTTWRNIYYIKALAAQSPAEFKVLKQKALKNARINLILRLALPLIGSALAGFGIEKSMASIGANVPSLQIGVVYSAICTAIIALANIPTIKSYFKSLRHLKYADKLFSILQTPEFKQANGVAVDSDWFNAADALAFAEREAFKHPEHKTSVAAMERDATGFGELLSNLDKALNAGQKKELLNKKQAIGTKNNGKKENVKKA